jgi:hypothetical protein
MCNCAIPSVHAFLHPSIRQSIARQTHHNLPTHLCHTLKPPLIPKLIPLSPLYKYTHTNFQLFLYTNFMFGAAILGYNFPELLTYLNLSTYGSSVNPVLEQLGVLVSMLPFIPLDRVLVDALRWERDGGPDIFCVCFVCCTSDRTCGCVVFDCCMNHVWELARVGNPAYTGTAGLYRLKCEKRVS